MPTVHLPYVDSALAHMEVGGPAALWHHLHWGLYGTRPPPTTAPRATWSRPRP